ncbi:hypothetical protein EG68_11778 [Paragonimus skrjabini miyazakii]|uniref:Uncharacterized protein n=1 Tax=Paragonimus skrjabini miyazakii TaxID=59628 RepID=A0A8S9YBC5_9TREM|nr:hypothetical protein EG68_11778 [Paragonimus skrjabini miyazakii]
MYDPIFAVFTSVIINTFILTHLLIPRIALVTGERATKKKLICAKYVPLGSTSTAISEIVINSRGQRLISGFTTVGELNSLSILYKLTTLPGTAVWSPPSAQRGSPSRSTHNSRTHSPVSHSGPTNSTHNASKEMYAFATKRRGTVHREYLLQIQSDLTIVVNCFIFSITDMLSCAQLFMCPGRVSIHQILPTKTGAIC